MKTVNHPQGSDAWLAHRRTTRNASDAPALMGASPYVSRAELVRKYATGVEREIDAATQAVFDKGHAIEPVLREVAEKIIGDDLYPITATSDDGYLGASFDGVTLDESIIFEAKQTNAGKIADIKGGTMPLADYWQVVQQFAVNESAQRCLYMCGDDAGAVQLWIERSQIEADIPKLRAAWAQFDIDVANYHPEAAAAMPVPVAKPVEGFGSLSLRVEGRVLASNLDAFKASADAFLARLPNPAELETDQDFSDADAAVKACDEAEKRIHAAKDAALAQMADVDAVLRTADTIAETIRAARLALDKAVKSEKERRRSEIAGAGVEAVRAHYATINSTLGEHAILAPQSLSLDIGGSIKGLRTLTSITDAVDAAVANAKIAASQRADAVRASVAALTAAMAGRETLFPDRVALCASKAPDDIRNLVAARIAEHEHREAAKLEAERERIWKEEAYKAAVEVRAGDVTGNQASVAQTVEHLTSIQGVVGSTPAGRSTNARIKLGDLTAMIAPLSITADGLAQLGFKPVGQDRAAKLYAADDLPHIFGKLASVIVDATKRYAVRRVAA